MKIDDDNKFRCSDKIEKKIKDYQELLQKAKKILNSSNRNTSTKEKLAMMLNNLNDEMLPVKITWKMVLLSTPFWVILTGTIFFIFILTILSLLI